jgi:hypothetical protein
MHVPFRCRYQLLVALAALIAVALCAAPAARAQTKPDWYAWNLKVDFPGSAPRVLLTNYQGVGGFTSPAAVTSQSTIDISSDCRTFGGLTVGGGKATFAANGYIRCKLPPAFLTGDRCTPKMGPFYWFATRALIDPTSISNPIFELVDGASATTARFSLPISGGRGQTQLVLPGATYLSAAWDRGTADNRVLMGPNGPSVISISDTFAVSNWLGFLTKPGWKNFMNTVASNKLGNWSEPQMAGWTTNRALEQWPDARSIYIGYSPSNGTYFTGTMWDGEVDPGCTAK